MTVWLFRLSTGLFGPSFRDKMYFINKMFLVMVLRQQDTESKKHPYLLWYTAEPEILIVVGTTKK